MYDLSGTKGAFTRSGFVLSRIQTVCNGASDPSNIVGRGECYYDTGSDLIIWTYHLTKFAAYIPTPAPVIPTRTGSGGGGVTLCKESWNCDAWTACEKDGQTRICTDKNSCGTTKSKPDENQSCTMPREQTKKDMQDAKNESANMTKKEKALFDIVVDVVNSNDKQLLAKISLINFGAHGNVTTHLDYAVKDATNLTVLQWQKDISVETQKEFIEDIDVSNLKEGEYYLQVTLTYDGQTEPASASKNFRMSSTSDEKFILVYIVALIILAAIYFKERGRWKAKSDVIPAPKDMPVGPPPVQASCEQPPPSQQEQKNTMSSDDRAS
jgi:hypothetical protein